MPAGLGGEVAGASATTTLLNPPPASLPATAGVAAPRAGAQVKPPSVDCITPAPLMPAYRMRAPAGEVGSRASARTSPPGAAPWVQLKPPSLETKSPKLDAR